MYSDRKIRVAVLYGGRSSEHEVSLQSAKNVIEQLDRSRYDVVPIGIDKKGQWTLSHDIFANNLQANQVPLVEESGSSTWFAPQWINPQQNKQEQAIVKRDLPIEKPFDVIFPVMHGTYCEDGALQGLLELADIAYVGCGVLSSAVNMDKDIAKRLAREGGVTVGPYLSFRKAQYFQDKTKAVDKINTLLKYPLFVKPANTGSSVGIKKVKTPEKLMEAIEFAFQFDNKILVENGIVARELEIAVLESLEDGKDPIVSVVGEIKPTHEFYSYEAKYLDANGAGLDIPANIPADIEAEAKEIAKQLFTLLECEGMARIDLFYEVSEHALYFNEVNTIPGFTSISMYPKLIEATGVTYKNLLTHLVELALKKQNKKMQLTRNYVNETS